MHLSGSNTTSVLKFASRELFVHDDKYERIVGMGFAVAPSVSEDAQFYNNKPTPAKIVGYRQSQDTSTRHVCRNCASWPRFSYVAQWGLPTNGQICSECMERAYEGRCRVNVLFSRCEQNAFAPED